MKKLLIHLAAVLTVAFLLCLQANAQVAINATGATPDASAMLDVASTTKGILIPRMTTAQRGSVTQAVGLLVYDTDIKAFYYSDGTSWKSINLSGVAASASANGYLTSDDWNTFNSKSAPIWVDGGSYTTYQNYVAIGTDGSATPLNKFYVTGTNASGYIAYIENTSTGTGAFGLKIRTGPSTPGNSAKFISFFNGAGGEAGSIRYDTNTSACIFYAPSDRRLKQNIVDTRFSIDTLMRIKVVDYDWINNPTRKQTGFIAQDLYSIYPTAVMKPDNDTAYWGINKEALVPLLVKSIQDQQTTIQTQQAQIADLLKRVQALEAK